VQEIDIWRVKALFNNFRKILQLNTVIFENMAELDRSMGGEYIFDKTYLEKAVRTIAGNVHHVTYNLNALTGNNHVSLYDRYQAIRTILDDILAGNNLSLACPPILPFTSLSWELEPLVGIEFVCLAELRHHPGIQMGDGFVITTEGIMALLALSEGGRDSSTDQTVDDVEKIFLQHARKLMHGTENKRLSITATMVNDDLTEARNLGEFFLEPTEDEQKIRIIDKDGQCREGDTTETSSESVFITTIEKTNHSVLHGLVQILRIFQGRAQHHESDAPARFAVLVRAALPVFVRGTVATRVDSVESTPLLTIIARPAVEEGGKDIYRLRRLYPFDLYSSNIAPKPALYEFSDNRPATGQAAGTADFKRGSALIDTKDIKALAETAMTLERIMGIPITLHWEYLQEGRFIVTRLFPFLEKPQEPTGKELADELKAAVVLCKGGRVVQAGIAAGHVIHISDNTELADFPIGAVAVAPMATPQLTPFLHRAAAILTEYGNPVGHLATVARELNLPALFGIPGVLDILTPGTEVTVDTGQMTVYQGVQNAMLQLGNSDLNFSPVDPEYRQLRRLLRYITPLNLIDPDAPQFSAEGCRTFHDIIHFCHEMAVDELAHFQERRPGLSGIKTSTMHLSLPMDIHLLDIGGGMKPSADFADLQPQPSEVSSEPFAVFLDGLLHPLASRQDPPVLGLRDIIAGIPRTSGSMAAAPDSVGKNLAILSQDYLNLSLHLGYHFNVIDAHLSDDRHRNYIYYRFIGGLADSTRRARRAQLIADVLNAMDFKVTCRDDLVVGRIKFERKDILRSTLFVLGALTTFSRQRDTGLYSDEQAREQYRLFADQFLLPFRQKNTTKQNIHQWSTSGPGQENSATSPLATVPAAYPPETK
jgi:phosphohistidine swiveling domain-containing protein